MRKRSLDSLVECRFSSPLFFQNIYEESRVLMDDGLPRLQLGMQLFRAHDLGERVVYFSLAPFRRQNHIYM
jgi:hypothetical protein